MSQDSDVDPFLQLAIDSQITQYAAVASVTIMAFDCLISLRREVEMVWRRPKSLVKWLYVSHEVFGRSVCTSVYLRQTPSDKTLMSRCFIYQRVQGTSATIIIGTVDIILLLRVWILCERSRRIMYVLLGMITEKLCSRICQLNRCRLCVTTIAVDTLTGCYAQDVPRYFSVFPIPSFIVSCSMFFVTVRNCIRRIAVSRPYITHSIAMVFLRDGIVWFLVISLLAPPQIALWAWGRQTLIQLLMMWVPLIFSSHIF
ncbi:hypothetical protein C8R44DRAFT_786470 [Mycena epipterygia]|nr:hypothetical protein C8R44DRAFT_786470 [Mycena epipterygia]